MISMQWVLGSAFCGQSYKCFTIVTYDSGVAVTSWKEMNNTISPLVNQLKRSRQASKIFYLHGLYSLLSLADPVPHLYSSSLWHNRSLKNSSKVSFLRKLDLTLVCSAPQSLILPIRMIWPNTLEEPSAGWSWRHQDFDGPEESWNEYCKTCFEL